MVENQIYEITVDDAKADAVHNTILTELVNAKAAGNIIAASWTRRRVEKGSV